MNTDKINCEIQRCKELLSIDADEELSIQQKRWLLIGALYMMKRFAELPNELNEEDIDEYYDHLIIEGEYELLKLDEFSDGEDWKISQ
jgi:hypothetical protein